MRYAGTLPDQLSLPGLLTPVAVDFVVAEPRGAGAPALGPGQVAAFQAVPAPVIVTGPRHGIVLFNVAAEALLGRRATEMLGRTLRPVLGEPAWERYVTLYDSLDDPDEPARVHGLLVARHPGGQSLNLECSLGRWEERGTSYVVTLLRDVTAQTRERDLMLRAHAELMRLAQRHLEQALQDCRQAAEQEAEERQAQVGRELHDSVGSSLVGATLALSAAKANAAPELVSLLDRALARVQATAEHVRRIARGILPAGTDPGALLPALEQFAQDLSALRHVQCTVRGRGDLGGIEATAGTHVYRIVQEAATNAIRHGHATLLQIRIAQTRDGYLLSVSDNGTGFGLDARRRNGQGVGIRSMEARARALGGTLRITKASPSGAGCRVRVAWPGRT